MTQIVIEVENQSNFSFLIELVKQLPFVKSARVEIENKKAKLLHLENEVAISRRQYKEGKTITLEKLMQDV